MWHQVTSHDLWNDVRGIMARKKYKLLLINLLYNKTIIGICFGEYQVLLNCKIPTSHRSIWSLQFNVTSCSSQQKSIFISYLVVLRFFSYFCCKPRIWVMFRTLNWGSSNAYHINKFWAIIRKILFSLENPFFPK